MTKRDADKLEPGLYKIIWKDGKTSVAAVGKLFNGSSWLACTEWKAIGSFAIASREWSQVQTVARKI